ncbi:SH2 domain-containing protein 2A-like [Dunckerocampus dactyliophorus]|uniref:SH2 domain-containing protein 2A-like n=1 Tax=Dunckerocampus dactyliophorus TaxID=161453 RepID=UPI0024061EF3|nr:SH2 domain-containing protein 2A-like [Dunckerocampus dactyliophorus]XP_054632436.1 SH2 domain-containing protein 2A-like [Dunckerocampus dactyliophorus]XP_054632437.1 SH2 domain-containing protein 2A-like [Dunckerocampus dactyliophorus]
MTSGSISGEGVEKKTSKQDSFQNFPWFKALRTRWRFRFKGLEMLEQREPSPRVLWDRKLTELSSKWFIETQVAHIAPNGFFPTWFVGFIRREDAEEMLKEKDCGCFLIRLSDKAIGYILSYRGRDRCRHFVISQSESGHFVVSGDSGGHDTVPELIQHYKTSPIEPFGEYLTSSCFETPTDRLYDVIVSSATEEKAHWNSKHPPLPQNSQRTLEQVPPMTRKGKQQDKGLYAKIKKQPARALQSNQQHTPGANTRMVEGCPRKCRPVSAPDTVYSVLYGPAELHTDRHSPTPKPRLSPKTMRPEKTYPHITPPRSHSTQHLSDGAVYFLAGRPGGPHTARVDTTPHTLHRHCDPVYTHDDTYEIIPGIEETTKAKFNSNTYESVEEIR